MILSSFLDNIKRIFVSKQQLKNGIITDSKDKESTED